MNLFTTLFTMRRVSMREIAEAAGVSLATVSYALRDHAKVSKATRERIKKIAAKLGYQPDPSFAVLGARRWEHKSSYNGIGIAFLAPPQAQWTRFQKLCFKGSIERSQQLGYKLEHFCPADYDSAEHLASVLEHRAFKGIILRRLNSLDILTEFPFERFSVIACGRGRVDPHCHLVMPHHQYNLFQAWDRLREQGHQRIGCVLMDDDPLAELPQFYIGALLQKQLDLPRKNRLPPFICTNRDRNQFLHWLAKWQPDALIGCIDIVKDWINLSDTAPAFFSLEKTSDRKNNINGLDLRPQLMGAVSVDQIDSCIRSNETGLPSIRRTILIESHIK